MAEAVEATLHGESALGNLERVGRAGILRLPLPDLSARDQAVLLPLPAAQQLLAVVSAVWVVGVRSELSLCASFAPLMVWSRGYRASESRHLHWCCLAVANLPGQLSCPSRPPLCREGRWELEAGVLAGASTRRIGTGAGNFVMTRFTCFSPIKQSTCGSCHGAVPFCVLALTTSGLLRHGCTLSRQ